MSIKDKLNRKIKMLLILIGLVFCIKLYILSIYIHISKRFEPIYEYKDNDIVLVSRIDHSGWKSFKAPVSTSTTCNPCKLFICVTAKDIIKAELLDLSLGYGKTIYDIKQYQIKVEKDEKENDYYMDIVKIPIPFEDGRTLKVKYKIKVIFKNKVIEKEIEAKFKCIMKVESGFKLFRPV